MGNIEEPEGSDQDRILFFSDDTSKEVHKVLAQKRQPTQKPSYTQQKMKDCKYRH